VINAEPRIAGEGVTEVFPERVDALARIKVAQGVAPLKLQELRIGLAHLGPEQRVVTPALRRVDVEIGRHHVVVAARHDDRHIGGDELFAVLVKPLEPPEFVVEFRAGRGIAVRQAKTSEID
jgi:hypothetical protein